MTTFNDRHLSGESRTSSAPDDLVERRYDYMLIGSSWDRRCLSLTETNISVGLTQLLLPENKGLSGLRDDHDERLLTYVSSVSDDFQVIEEPSEDVDTVFDRIELGIRDLRKTLNRPISILIDLSAMARYFTLGATSIALNDSTALHLDVLYSEGLYGDVIATSSVPATEYISAWDATAVPRLEGDWYPDQPRHFLVSVGFESTKLARLVERWDPDQVSILFPRPGIRPEYEASVSDANDPWMTQFEIDPKDVISASPVDAIGAWSTLTAATRLNSSQDNVYCLAAGSKPHALALTLYSLAREKPAVLYMRPTLHQEKDIKSNGNYWMYRLRDRTMIAD
jgi:hypothetical protein